MALPNENITQIPDNEPDAVPSLWNTRYYEIDANFQNLDGRAENVESELSTAREGESSLDERLDKMAHSIEGLDPDMQNALVGMASEALDIAGLAAREIETTLTKRFQTGQTTIKNRGIIKGCAVTKSGNATRNLNLAEGVTFKGGRIIPATEQLNGASVPSNTSDSAKSCYAYLSLTGDVFSFACTELGGSVPSGGIPLYRVDVPAGNTEANDAYLASCALADLRRMEPGYPQEMATSPTEYVALDFDMDNTEYQVALEVESFSGSGFQLGYFYTANKAVNGFDIYYNGTADDLKIRWTARKLDM